MKKLLIVLFVIGFSLPVLSQRGDALFFKKLSSHRRIDRTVKMASSGIYNNYSIRDSLLYFTSTFERAVLSGKQAGAITPELVKTAQKKYPGKSITAVKRRLNLYATKGKKGF